MRYDSMSHNHNHKHRHGISMKKATIKKTQNNYDDNNQKLCTDLPFSITTDVLYILLLN